MKALRNEEGSVMKNKGQKGFSLTARILAAVIAAMLAFGSIAGVLIFVLA